MIELIIQNGSDIYIPSVEDGIKLTLERKGKPGKLEFSVMKDDILNFEEGNSVRLKVNGTGVFYGFVFAKKRSNDETIHVTAYDQLRYLKNKDTYVYENKTANELVEMIAKDFNLNVGQLDNTGFKIASKIEDNQTLFDIILNALDDTLMNRNKLYVLYDNFGALELKDIENMKLDILIDEETGESFDYSSSIDGETYNKIKLVRDNEETGKREVYVVQHGENINRWGILQYFESIDENVNAQAKADALLSLYNKKKRSLKIKNAFGDPRVRGGSSVIVKMDLGDVKLQNYMVVEKVTHTFYKDDHVMNLEVRGGLING